MPGRPVVRARAWLLAAQDTASVAGGGAVPLTGPQGLAPWPMTDHWPGGYIASLDVRPVGPPRPGRATVWVSTPLALVAGEPCSPLASYLALVDTANGIAVRESPKVLSSHSRRPPGGRASRRQVRALGVPGPDPRTGRTRVWARCGESACMASRGRREFDDRAKAWIFPNVDLTVHLHRRPEGRWTGLDTTVVFGPAGQGITSTVLHDVHGPVGHAQQILTVRPVPGA
nr:hypothetical protein StreXyl84_57210 [Streptomyces sp. Xyl84]